MASSSPYWPRQGVFPPENALETCFFDELHYQKHTKLINFLSGLSSIYSAFHSKLENDLIMLYKKIRPFLENHDSSPSNVTGFEKSFIIPIDP